MNQKKPRENKTKDQIAWEMKQKAEAQRKRAFIGEFFYPMLLAHLNTVTQAKNFCKVFQSDLLSTFNQGMTNPVSSLELEKRFEGVENEAATAYRAALDVFKGLPIGEALDLLDGMPGAIEAALNADSKDKPLRELEWIDGTLLVKKTNE